MGILIVRHWKKVVVWESLSNRLEKIRRRETVPYGEKMVDGGEAMTGE